MNRQDLQWLLAFAKSHSLMNKSIIVVLPLWLRALKNYYDDMIDGYWIDVYKEIY